MDEQDFVFDLCQHYNIFLTGQAGTGKTFLSNQLISCFNLKYGSSKVGVIASTGKAALHVGGSTIHSFFGIGIASRSCYQLVESVLSQEDVVLRIRSLQVLILDEVSMLSSDLFEKIEFICR